MSTPVQLITPLLEDRRFYVYAHSKSTTGEIFYLGKGHKRRAWCMNYRSAHHRRMATKHSCDVHVLERNLMEKEAFARERQLILEARELGIRLVNLTDGGEGAINPSQETRAKISAGNLGKTKGRPKSAEMRARLRASIARNGGSPAKGKPRSAETRARMREAIARRGGAHNKGKKTGRPAHNRGKPGTMLGKTLTAAQRAKISASKRARDDLRLAGTIHDTGLIIWLV